MDDVGRYVRRLTDRVGMNRTVLGLTDQTVTSAASFITMLIVARALSASEFGRFALIFGVLLLANTLQSSLVAQPHNVLGAALDRPEYIIYTTSTALGQLLLTSGLALLGLGAGAFLGPLDREISSLVFALIPALVAGQLQEFNRRVLYTEDRLGGALIADSLAHGARVIGLGAFVLFQPLTAALAFYIIALGSGVGAFVGYLQIRRSLSTRVDLKYVRQNLAFGKWFVGAEIGAWIWTQSFLYFVGVLLGVSGAGIFRAAQLLTSPLNVPQFYLYAVLPSRFSRRYRHGGEDPLLADVRAVLGRVLPLVALYCVAVGAAGEPLLRLVYGGAYSGAGYLVALFALIAFLAMIQPVLSSALRAIRAPEVLLRGNLWAAAIAVLAGWVLVAEGGLAGAGLGFVATILTLDLYGWVALKRRAERGTQLRRERLSSAQTQRKGLS
jgi:O-antigen/teichoic acid export membrane protein